MGETERRNAIAQLFGNAGLLTADNDERPFVSATIVGYLVACLIVGRKPSGPLRLRLLARKRLVLKETWPDA